MTVFERDQQSDWLVWIMGLRHERPEGRSDESSRTNSMTWQQTVHLMALLPRF